jgi:hypothetical protein
MLTCRPFAQVTSEVWSPCTAFPESGDPRLDAPAEDDLGLAADDAGDRDDALHHVLQVGVVAGDYLAQHVGLAGDRVGFQHFRDPRQSPAGLVEHALGQVEMDVGEAGKAHRGRGDVRAVAAEHAGALQRQVQLVELARRWWSPSRRCPT